MKKFLFKEEQGFVGTWIWYLVLSINLLLFVGTVMWLSLMEKPEGSIGLIITILVSIVITWLLYRAKLVVTIDQKAIYYKFFPFVTQEKMIKKDDVKQLYLRKYKPILEYGGWGYRHRSKSGRALIVSGNTGLQIEGNNDRKILIGTKKSDQLEYAIRKLKENWRMKNAK